MHPHILPVDVHVATFSAFEVVEGDRQVGEIIDVVADSNFVDGVGE